MERGTPFPSPYSWPMYHLPVLPAPLLLRMRRSTCPPSKRKSWIRPCLLNNPLQTAAYRWRLGFKTRRDTTSPMTNARSPRLFKASYFYNTQLNSVSIAHSNIPKADCLSWGRHAWRITEGGGGKLKFSVKLARISVRMYVGPFPL